MAISYLEIKRATDAVIAECSPFLTPQMLGECLALSKKIQAAYKCESFNAKLKVKWPAKLIANREAIAQQGPRAAMLFENDLFFEVCKEIEEELEEEEESV
jgi:hypothetical protein